VIMVSQRQAVTDVILERAATVAPTAWQLASPKWDFERDFDDATYDRTAGSFDDSDHVDIVIHNYRRQLSLTVGERQYDELEARLFEDPAITVPTISIAFDGTSADGSTYAHRFAGPYSHQVLEGIGHNVPQEAPKACADAILEVGGTQ
jgi:pimeloyl-ACP methyl ester carboxylesterase